MDAKQIARQLVTADTFGDGRRIQVAGVEVCGGRDDTHVEQKYNTLVLAVEQKLTEIIR